MKTWSRGVAFAVALGVPGLVATPQASAQFNTPSPEMLELSTSTTFVAVGLSALAIAIPLILTTSIGVSVVGEKGEMEAYLRKNEFEVREALAVGSGGFIDEMSQRLGFDEREHAAFGRVVRREREVLSKLADPTTLTPERAAEFAQHLAVSMNADPTVGAALERHR